MVDKVRNKSPTFLGVKMPLCPPDRGLPKAPLTTRSANLFYREVQGQPVRVGKRTCELGNSWHAGVRRCDGPAVTRNLCPGRVTGDRFVGQLNSRKFVDALKYIYALTGSFPFFPFHFCPLPHPVPSEPSPLPLGPAVFQSPTCAVGTSTTDSVPPRTLHRTSSPEPAAQHPSFMSPMIIGFESIVSTSETRRREVGVVRQSYPTSCAPSFLFVPHFNISLKERLGDDETRTSAALGLPCVADILGKGQNDAANSASCGYDG